MVHSLSPQELITVDDWRDVPAFAQEIQNFDQTPAFSEQTLVEASRRARAEKSSARGFALMQDSQILALAILLAPSSDEPGLIELAVAPSYRNKGLATSLCNEIAESLGADISSYALWAHQVQGDSAALQVAVDRLTRSFGFVPARQLHKMRLELTDQLRSDLLGQEVNLPSQTSLKPFSEQDAQAWVQLNAAAFADHPEQGSLTLSDLQDRLNSSWYRPQGFFILQTPQGPAGYIWLKIPDQQKAPYEGEIYALGISPVWQGKGLGKALTQLGLKYLAQESYQPGTPLDQAVLYVDASNTAAVNLYQSLGFTSQTVDTQYIHQNLTA